MKKNLLFSILTGSVLALSSLVQNALALDNGIDPYNLRKGDWIYVLSDATNKLGGHVSTVTDIPSLMTYEKNKGMNFIVVKAGTGSTNFPSNSNKQFTSTLVTAAHNAGLKIFAYTRSYGTDVPGEIKLATNCLVLGADGFIIDAEMEWEGLANKETKATNLCQGIKAVFPNKFLGHSPAMYISLHNGFPLKQFNLFCDAVMPQAYWYEFGITPQECAADLDQEWNNWQNTLTGGWTNAIKPIAPIGQAWSSVTGTEITDFYNAIKNTSTPATKIGYQGCSWWRADLHTSGMWTAIGGSSIGVDPATAPVISDVTVSAISPSQATITWTTDQSSDSVVDYGVTTSYGSTKTVAGYVINHSVTLTGLSASTTYYFRVKSKNLNNVLRTVSGFSFTTLAPGQVDDIILDNTDAAVISGTWSTGSSSTDKYGADYRYKASGTGSAYVQYQPNILTAGDYNVYEWHPAGSNRSSAAPVLISYNGGSTTVNVNQKVNGGAWNLLGTWRFTTGSSGYVRIKDNCPDTTQLVMADAIKFSYYVAGTPPAAPSGLTANVISASQINLSWTDNSTNENNFVIARSTVNGGPYTDIATLGANSTTYSDTTVAAGTTYYYVVRATNANGSSANSNQAAGTTPATVPAAPSNLAATAVSSSQVNLTWTDNSSNESNFVVARSTVNGGPYTDIATLGANVTSYSDTTVSASTTYYYVVRASNASGSSANSNQASATTPSLTPAPPSNLIATPLSSSAIKLTWSDNSSNESGFIVSRATSSGGPYTDIATLGANTTVYTNTGLSAGTTYYYVVRSYNGAGSSVYSAQAGAAPVADIIIDNLNAVFTGTWSTGTTATDKYGADYRYVGPGTGTRYAVFTPTIPVAGNYQVYEWHSQGSNRTTEANVQVNYNGGSSTVLVNQQINGGTWVLLGTYNFAAGTAGNVRINDVFTVGNVVMADAIKFVLSN